MTAEVLRKAGYDVLEASTAEKGLETARAHHPDLVLLDVMLPDVSGIEICRRIKEDPSLQDVMVILTSGISISSECQVEGLNTGADGYIIKPIPNEELLARIKSMERIKMAEDALRDREKQNEQLILELKKALTEIKTLKGFIPICASCKKIRDDEGYWKQLETYISEHTDAMFSHSICPECLEKFRSDIKEKFPE